MYTLLLKANSVVANHSNQLLCLWLIYILRYFSSSWFGFSVCLSICRWKAINSFVSIPNILFNFLIKSTTNYDPLFEIILSGNLSNFHTLSLNNLTNSLAIIFSVVTIKCNIFKNLSHIIKIESWPLNTCSRKIKTDKSARKTMATCISRLYYKASISALFFIFWHWSLFFFFKSTIYYMEHISRLW